MSQESAEHAARHEPVFWFGAALVMGLAGNLLAMLIRAQITWPEQLLVYPDIYVGMVTIHGTVMVFFFLLPALFGGLTPAAQCGGKVFYSSALLFSLGSVGMVVATFLGPPMSGWRAIVPLALMPGAAEGSGVAQTVWFASMAVTAAALTFVCLRHLAARDSLTRWAGSVAAMGLALLTMLFLFASLDREVLISETGQTVYRVTRSVGYRFMELGVLAVALGISRRVIGLEDEGARGLRPWFLFAAIAVFRELFSASQLLMMEAAVIVWLIVRISMSWTVSFRAAIRRSSVASSLGLATSVFVVLALVAELWGQSVLLSRPGPGTFFAAGALHIHHAAAGYLACLAGVAERFTSWTSRRLHPALARVHIWSTVVGLLLFVPPLLVQGAAGRTRYSYDSDILRSWDLPISAFAVVLVGAQLLFVVNVVWSALAGDESKAEQDGNSM